jgi:hypothetical protein
MQVAFAKRDELRAITGRHIFYGVSGTLEDGARDTGRQMLASPFVDCQFDGLVGGAISSAFAGRLAMLAAITAAPSRPFAVFIVSSPCFLQLCCSWAAVDGSLRILGFILHIIFVVEHRANPLAYLTASLCVRCRDPGLTGRPGTVTNVEEGDGTS